MIKSNRTSFEKKLAEAMDVRTRVEKGLGRITAIQYTLYLCASITLCAIAVFYYFFIEKDVECWVAKSVAQ